MPGENLKLFSTGRSVCIQGGEGVCTGCVCGRAACLSIYWRLTARNISCAIAPQTQQRQLNEMAQSGNCNSPRGCHRYGQRQRRRQRDCEGMGRSGRSGSSSCSIRCQACCQSIYGCIALPLPLSLSPSFALSLTACASCILSCFQILN